MRRWLSYRGVTELTSLSESTIRRLIAAGQFPAPLEVTEGRKVFDEKAVEGAMKALIATKGAKGAITAFTASSDSPSVKVAPRVGMGPAKVGERRIVKGQLAEWDGIGWLAVRPKEAASVTP